MKYQVSAPHDNFDDPLAGDAEVMDAFEGDLWFLPGSFEVEPENLPPGPRAEPRETAVLEEWRKAEASHAASLARVAARLGALDDRLRRGSQGWRHRLP